MNTFELVCLLIFTHGLHAFVSALAHQTLYDTDEAGYGIIGFLVCLLSTVAGLISYFT